MDDFLTAVSSTTVKRSKVPETLIKKSTSKNEPVSEVISVRSPEEALKALKDQPDLRTVDTILNFFLAGLQTKDGFNLVTPGPLSAQIMDVIISTTIPDLWQAIKESESVAKHMIRCIQSPNGLGAILSRLRPLITDAQLKKSVDQTRDPTTYIKDLLEVLEKMLVEDDATVHIWKDCETHAQNSIQKKLMWKEYVAQVASGRLVTIVAQSEDALKGRGGHREESWLANGGQYSSWLGRQIALLMKETTVNEDYVCAVTELCGKATTMGFLDCVVGSIVEILIEHDSQNLFATYLTKLKAHEQRKYLNSTVTYTTKKYIGSNVGFNKTLPPETPSSVSALAALFNSLVKDNDLLKDHLVTSLINSSIPALDDSLYARRSAISAVAQDDDQLQNLLEKSLKLFGDSFYVSHTPLLQQEALAQTLAITCGYVQRSQPMFLTMMAKSSYHVMGMSHRIGATSPKARFLGIAIGTAISKMVDKPDLQLKFDLEGEEASEAMWYQHLTGVKDKVGQIKDLKSHDMKDVTRLKASTHERRGFKRSAQSAKPSNMPAVAEITGPRIVEILDDSSDEDDDLVAYGKPDSDPEDDADDPTEINRNKPTAPVYIRDLIAGLRDQEDYDRHQLALSTAASLIRRKANFGSEVTDHLEELASILTGLNDNFELSGFPEQRQRALIAVLFTKPGPMAQWFARSFFSGDYSLTQRIAMLTTLGIGARELAGLKDSTTEDLIPPTPSFPSQELPSKLHRIYGEDTNPVARITSGLAKQLLSPIAATAADQLSGPNILKVRTFSSRMEVERRKSKPIPNALAQIVADNFFFPLTGRWWITTRSSSTSDSLYTSQHLLPPFLHTLALLLNAAGPNTLSLPQMTRELWELLLSVRTFAGQDKGVLSSLLFAFLMLLETNEDKERIAMEQAKELLETQEWVRMVFEGLGAGSEEDEKIRVLAAGVVIRCQEVVEKYQRRMAGSMMDY
ncbi:hypothetical protein P154DRAFT_620965 [Amniculicola lignicola CBS 123094]|uniref:Telomere length regulation protein conserved domain-containing protein n=1 Tax=Amniculicola lignicola CBS 123094 TaxID=1392246 RepID=A0A6A5WKA8_9PLEO|nr:hypothetical protein P154DRAFT_620965 [Amniculicola lignicola CBS 123094]